ncbi:MAG TPA: hypothetical protein VH044_19700 [Polyangiaceae bacterium]|jgi:hypothetical protein|nr:hypothetical protein [Polyangiaceae bacterium]
MVTAPTGDAPTRAVPAPATRATPAPPRPAAALDPARAGVPDAASPFALLLRSLGREIHQGESLVRSALGAARGGHDLDAGDLIALQAGVYRYGEAVDLASRLVDRATTAVKTVLQGQ